MLPPTLTLQYHFDRVDHFKPYVGAGVNYTHFYKEDAGVLSKVKYDDKFGLALQTGVDVPFYKNKYCFNVDVKKVFLKTKASFNNGAVVADVRLNPWIFGVGIGRKF